jgi:two-component system cell cycle sensor histidine kinase/response regulator CckA
MTDKKNYLKNSLIIPEISENYQNLTDQYVFTEEYEEKFRQVFEHAPLGIALIDSRWKIIDANHKLCGMLEYSAEEITGMDIRQITYSGDLGSTFQMMNKVYNGEIDNYEIKKRYIRSDGILIPVGIHSAAIRSQTGKLQYSVLMVQDLSLEETQYRQLKLLGHSVNCITEMVCITDRDNKFIFCNRAFLEKYGYKEEEVLGNIPQILHPDSGRVINMLNTRARWSGELINRKKNGELFPIYLETSEIKNETGEPIGYIGIARDITAEKIMEADHKKLSKAVEQNPAAIIITDRDGKIEYVNPKFVAITGYGADEVIGKNPGILKSGNKTRKEYDKLWLTLLSGNEWRGEFINKKKSGELFYEYAIISPIKDSRGEITHFVGIQEDITARKEAEAHMKRAENLAELGRMTSYISHEIKTPLTAIKLNIEMLMEQLSEEKRCAQSFRIMNKEINRLDKLLKDILQFSRRKECRVCELRADDLLSQVVNLLEPVLTEKHISIINNISSEYVKGEADELKTMLHQMIENSIEAIEDGGEIEFLSAIDTRKNMHRIFMRDTGCGIKHSERIFEPFHTTKKSGTGLGLSIVHQIMEKQHGSVSLIFSEPGNTIFQISLPLAELNGEDTNN